MSIFRLKPKNYSDATIIEGVYRNDSKMELGLYKLCKEYYDKYFHKPKVGEEERKDIFQSSLLALWDNIRNRILYVADGELKGKDGSPFTSTLTTYFMGIVNNKYLEWLHKSPIVPSIDINKEKVPENCIDDAIECFDEDDEAVRRKRIVSHRVGHMAKQCNKILTLFYYEEKNYDEIMMQMPTFQSKDALKTAKYKCLKRLRESVTGTYC